MLLIHAYIMIWLYRKREREQDREREEGREEGKGRKISQERNIEGILFTCFLADSGFQYKEMF